MYSKVTNLCLKIIFNIELRLEIVPEDFDWTGSEDNEMVTSLKNFIKQVAESNDRLTAQVNSLHIKFNGCNAKVSILLKA